MPRPRLQKTLADYLAIAVTPVLIMLLVGSLVFFLQSLFYDGRHSTRVLWILVWFVIGAVLVARIAMESGRGYASAFTLALAGATSLAIFRFADAPLVPIVCLGIIWWCTDKLTWDCTLIDDSEDASGEGLLQVAGVTDETEMTADHPGEPAEASRAAPADPDEHGSIPLWKRLFLNESERSGKPHAPGLWVVYFSLAALPLFGFGQVMLPPGDAKRQFAFQCLVVYVASGLGLLLLTSFLGLRRYLRQRNLQMPVSMALTWIGMGSAMIVGILVVCLILPRPEGEYDVTAMVDQAGEKIQEAAEQAFLDDSSGAGEGQRSGEAEEHAGQGAASDARKRGESAGASGQQKEQSENASDGEQGRQQGGEQSGRPAGEGDQQAADTQQEGKPTGENEQSEKNTQPDGETQQPDSNDGSGSQTPRKKDPEASDSGERTEMSGDSMTDNAEAGEQQQQNRNGDDGDTDSNTDSPTPQTPDVSNAVSLISRIFQWVVYGTVALVAVYLIWRNWPACSAFLSKLWAEFLSLFGRRPVDAPEQIQESEVASAPRRPFSEFSDPFVPGAARRKSPSELVRYSFEALQAWAVENGCPRDPHQTPDEFGQQLRRRQAVCAVEGQAVSQLYARMAYTGHRPGEESLPLLERLWRKMA